MREMRDGKGARERERSRRTQLNSRLIRDSLAATHMHSRTQVDDEKERQEGRSQDGERKGETGAERFPGRHLCLSLLLLLLLLSRTEGKERNENRIEKK